MSPVTQGPMGRLTSGLRLVSRNPNHFRNGRWFLLAEGGVLIALGTAGFISAATHPDAPPTGAPVLVLALTPWHSAILFGSGMLAVFGVLQRRAAIAVTALSAVVFVALVIIGAVSAAHQVPGPLGFEPRDIVLHGVLAVTNFAVLYWLIPDVLEGPDWVPRLGTRPQHRPEPTSPPAGPIPLGSDDPITPAANATAPEPKARGTTHPQQSHTERSSP
jgi:Domain of unknown function (DUF4383)